MIIVDLIKKIREKERLLYCRKISRTINHVGKNFIVRKRVNIMNGKYISIGDNFLAMNGCRIEAWDQYCNNSFSPEITIGNNVSMNFDCHIGAINHISIGDNVLLGSRVFITDHSHGNGSMKEVDIPPNKRELYSKGPVIIEDNVWIGEGAVILSNVRVGKGSIIGANAVVTKDIPAYCVVGGVPAKILRKM